MYVCMRVCHKTGTGTGTGTDRHTANYIYVYKLMPLWTVQHYTNNMRLCHPLHTQEIHSTSQTHPSAAGARSAAGAKASTADAAATSARATAERFIPNFEQTRVMDL